MQGWRAVGGAVDQPPSAQAEAAQCQRCSGGEIWQGIGQELAGQHRVGAVRAEPHGVGVVVRRPHASHLLAERVDDG